MYEISLYLDKLFEKSVKKYTTSNYSFVSVLVCEEIIYIHKNKTVKNTYKDLTLSNYSYSRNVCFEGQVVI